MFRVTVQFASATLIMALLLMAPFMPGHAARPLETGALPESDLELVVLELENCTYCGLFRRDALPLYQASGRAQKVPIRFLDLNDRAADDLDLDGPVTVVPTVVLMKGNREIGRVPGYIGPENFFHAVNHMIGGAE